MSQMYESVIMGSKMNRTLQEELVMELAYSGASLSRCRTMIEQRASAAGFKGFELWGIVSAVFEACTNAVTHGKSSGSSAKLYILIYKDRFEAVVKDNGSGFYCPVDTPMPPVTSQRGRGIPLMKSFMDEVHFKNGDGCTVTLIKYLNKGLAN